MLCLVKTLVPALERGWAWLEAEIWVPALSLLTVALLAWVFWSELRSGFYLILSWESAVPPLEPGKGNLLTPGVLGDLRERNGRGELRAGKMDWSRT